MKGSITPAPRAHSGSRLTRFVSRCWIDWCRAGDRCFFASWELFFASKLENREELTAPGSLTARLSSEGSNARHGTHARGARVGEAAAEMPVRDPSLHDPCTSLMRIDREPIFGVPAHTVWRQHIAKEETAAANLLGNLLTGSGPGGMSFLASSVKDGGSWASSANRRNVRALAIQRLDSRGMLPGPLQMTSSSQHLGRGDELDDVPDDFSPSPTGRRTPSPWGSDSGELFGRPRTAAFSFGRKSTATIELNAVAELMGQRTLSRSPSGSSHSLSTSLSSSLSRPQSGTLIRSASMQSIGSWGSHWDDDHHPISARPPSAASRPSTSPHAPVTLGLDSFHPRPPGLISAQPGLLASKPNLQYCWKQRSIAGKR